MYIFTISTKMTSEICEGCGNKDIGIFEIVMSVLLFIFTGYTISKLIEEFDLFLFILILFIFGYAILALCAGVNNLK